MNGCVNSPSGTTRTGWLGRQAQEPLQQELQALSRRCLQGLFAFLSISVGFFQVRQLDLLAPLTQGVQEFLGCPPPPVLTTLALGIYLFSEVVLILGRTGGGARPALKWQQLVYRSIFFFFYAVAGVLDGYFLGVFVAGLVLYGLELLNLWTYSMKHLPQEREMAGKL